MNHVISRLVPVALVIASVGTAVQVDARLFRMRMVPNAIALGVSCNICHTEGRRGGTPRNSFGLAVEALVTSNGREVFWGPELAALDSDGDGASNGVELGDPEGTWSAGDDAPEGEITHPGDPDSFVRAAVDTAVEALSWAMVKSVVRHLVE